MVPSREETYAIVLALLKWATWIGMQPLVILTDHKCLESWAKEHLDTPSGPGARRARWHELMSRFDLSVVYVPGKGNVAADGLSRWAYPAAEAFSDVSIHGSAQDEAAMLKNIEEERLGEHACCFTTLSSDWAPAMEALFEEFFDQYASVFQSGQQRTPPRWL